MKKRNVFVCLWAIFLIFSFIKGANAEEFGGVEFPDGELSFADVVISYEEGAGVTPPYNSYPDKSLGIPDWEGTIDDRDHYISLGHGGTIILQFTDNSLTTSSNSDPDLWIFEIGENEKVFVLISNDLINWISVGGTGNSSGIDIDAYTDDGVVIGEKYNFVMLIDVGNDQPNTNVTSGADIDAVGAISSGPSCDTDEDGICDAIDNCPYRGNPAQTDWDNDGVGDTCDPDTQDNDMDGVDNRIDNCENELNFYQFDADDDGVGDVCDGTPGCGGCGRPFCEEIR